MYMSFQIIIKMNLNKFMFLEEDENGEVHLSEEKEINLYLASTVCQVLAN